MSPELVTLSIAAATLAFGHTLLGPDHYLPFIVMAKARDWSLTKTSWITFLCGLGHVVSSVVLGAVGIALGMAADKALLGRLEGIESFRGDLAGWLLTGFGLAYLVWGIRRAIRNRPHVHGHLHEEHLGHAHEHTHQGEHAHVHDAKPKKSLTPWILFTIFVFGPCEPLIPVLMYPAAKQMNVWAAVPVAVVFSAVTIATMLAVVLVATFGLNVVPMQRLQRYSHALAGATIFACGIAIHLGL